MLRLSYSRKCAMTNSSLSPQKQQWKKFLSLCQLYKLVPLPATVCTVALFVAHLSVASYVYSPPSLHRMHNLPSPDLKHLAVEGLRRPPGALQPAKTYHPGASAVIAQQLGHIFAALWHTFWTSCSIAFFLHVASFKPIRWRPKLWKTFGRAESQILSARDDVACFRPEN